MYTCITCVYMLRMDELYMLKNNNYRIKLCSFYVFSRKKAGCKNREGQQLSPINK